MTEKTVLQQISNLAFDIQHADDLQVAFDKASEILKLTDQNNPPFAVGEYRAYKDRIYKITEDHETYICCIELVDGVLINDNGSYKTGEFYHGSTPATAEQIEMFKIAEIKSDIGLIINNGDFDWSEIVEDIEEYLDEELQEVGER
jgi:hypothetical protein